MGVIIVYSIARDGLCWNHQERCKNQFKLNASNDAYFDQEPLALAA